ncbi:RteC domain-containing protein [Flavobacterium luteolum]|uniref:RteC domain-containing protein n=1 Tax=Flavobacterium luteolum TaxID=3003259 RepID=UPI00248E84F6|nr:RteC domain-containing protein [Flavobacterium luteolum]
MKIYYTLTEFAENYQNDLHLFLDDYEDNECVDFWKEQRQVYKKCIQNVTITKDNTLDEFRTLAQNNGNIIDAVFDKIHTVESVPCIVDYDGRDLKIFKDEVRYNFELAEKLKRSFEKILQFIEDLNSPKIEEESEKEFFDKLDTIRNGEGTEYEITVFLKEVSNNYDVDLLKSISKDIELYLFIEKDIIEAEFSPEEINSKIEEYTKRGIPIPYNKRRSEEELTEKQKEMRNKLRSNGALISDAPSINYEQFLYPFEFMNIYALQMQINRKLKELVPKQPEQIIEVNTKVTWNGTQTDFIELIKALIENGNLKGTQSELIKNLSAIFSIEIKNPSKLINDIKKRNNGSETLFLDKLKKSLFDYITLEKRK